MPTRPHEERVLDLLERWEKLRQAGEEVNVETLCAGCPELTDELRRRTGALERLNSFLTDGESETAPIGAFKPDGPEGPDDPASPILIPAVMSFRNLRFHARGGSGDVFEGYDESLRRSVAIKVLGRHRADSSESRRRFENEAEITSRLEHPGIAPVYGVGSDKDGHPYYAMRFIRGETFQRAIERFHSADRSGRDPGERRLAFRQLLVRFQEVCNTVAYAHNRGILHRDLKLRNVMLGEFGETIVVDWGLGKRLGQESPRPVGEPGRNGQGEDPINHVGHTRPDEAMGSPGYMSPEQAAGDLDRIGPASDLYSLGVILYCLLTGRAAFSGRDVAAIIRRTRTGDFSRPSQVNRLVHPALEAVCLKAMALRPEERYGSPTELAKEIGRWLAGEPVECWREPLATRALRWVRRHRMLVTSGAVALISCLIALGYFFYDSQIRATQQAARRLAEARGLVEALKVADVRAVPEIVRQLDPDIELVSDRLYAMARSASTDLNSGRHRTAAAIALLRNDASQAEYLVDRLTHEQSSPAELEVIREALQNRADADSVAPRVWKLLEGGPRARSEFVHLLAQVEKKSDKLIERILSSQDDDRTRATLVLALGGYQSERFAASERSRIVEGLLSLFRSSPEPGLHSAISWLLRHQWGLGQELSDIEAGLAPEDREATRSGQAPTRNWYVNGQMQTLAVIRGPVEFRMGSPAGELGRRPWAEDRLSWRIERTFAIATHEVTRSQYKRFIDENPDVFRPDRPESFDQIGKYMPEPDCSVIGINWYEAVRYCNWLSLKEGIRESEWCYPKNIDSKKPLMLSPNYLSGTGYRLPTEAEWEFACRSGTETARPFGESGVWMASYAWFLGNSDQRTHPVGSKKPNDLGLFDMLGNAIECTFQIYDPPGDYLVRDKRGVALDREIPRTIEHRRDCMLRGGSFYYDASFLRSANRNWNSPALRENTFGFRVARTLRIPDEKLAPVSRVPQGGSGKK